MVCLFKTYSFPLVCPHFFMSLWRPSSTPMRSPSRSMRIHTKPFEDRPRQKIQWCPHPRFSPSVKLFVLVARMADNACHILEPLLLALSFHIKCRPHESPIYSFNRFQSSHIITQHLSLSRMFLSVGLLVQGKWIFISLSLSPLLSLACHDHHHLFNCRCPQFNHYYVLHLLPGKI